MRLDSMRRPSLKRFAGAIALALGAVAIAPAPALQAAPAAAVQLAAAPTPKPAYMLEGQPLQLKDYQEPTPKAPDPWYVTFLGFLFKLALVLAVAYGALWALKRYQNGQSPLPLPTSKGRNLVVLETAPLGGQAAMHLVSLGGERLLVVGASPNGGLRTLDTISDPELVSRLLEKRKPNPSAFNDTFDLAAVVAETDDPSGLLAETLRDLRNREGGA